MRLRGGLPRRRDSGPLERPLLRPPLTSDTGFEEYMHVHEKISFVEEKCLDMLKLDGFTVLVIGTASLIGSGVFNNYIGF